MTIENLIELVAKYDISAITEIRRAYEFACEAHQGQFRQSGEPYIIHPLNVAYTLAEMQADKETIIAGLLHDVVEDTHYTIEDIAKYFGSEVAKLVSGVTKLAKMEFSSKTEENDANTRKIITSVTEDVRIIIIKLADRLHNMRTLSVKKKEKQVENSNETLEIFVPLASRIGAYRIKTELEDLSFSYINPDMYKNIEEELEKVKKDSAGCIKEILKDINGLLSAENIPHEIKTRTKNIYGIYKDIIEKKEMAEIHDLLALKVMVKEVKDCYLTLMLIHSIYNPMNSELKDYICNHKSNMYRSLHTTIFGPENRLVQTQIRTFEMDKVASFGLTAYWATNGSLAREKMQENLKEQFVKTLNEINHTIKDDNTFVSQVRAELFENIISVYTPKGEIIELPTGSTAIDFAYQIHTKVGDNMAGVLINEQPHEITTVLKHDDRVTVLTDPNTLGPQKYWLRHVKTTRAKRKIEEYIKHERKMETEKQKMKRR